MHNVFLSCYQHVINKFMNLDVINTFDPAELPQGPTGTQSYNMQSDVTLCHMAKPLSVFCRILDSVIIPLMSLSFIEMTRGGILPVVIQLPLLQLLCDVRT